MDFDMLAQGHGPIGDRTHVTLFREYIEDLYTSVVDAARLGKSLDEMKGSIKLEKHKDWGQYEAWLPMNVEGVYQRLRLQRQGN